MAQGIETRTDKRGRKSYRGVINTKTTGKKNGPWGSHAEAVTWRRKALGEVEAGTAARPSTRTLRDAWQDFIEGAEAGTVMDRTGTPYKPSTLRGYRRGWAKIDPELGAHRLADLRLRDVQGMVDAWGRKGMAASTIRNSLDPLRSLYRREVKRGNATINPTTDLDVPRVNGKRDRIASKEEAAALIEALPEREKAIWATALYGGLRRGELRALRWRHVNLAAGLIDVRDSWDDEQGEQKPKTAAGARKVPMVRALRGLLEDHQKATGRSGDDLAFGRTADLPFTSSTINSRAKRAWRAAGLDPITLHECRHTCASLMIAAGCNAKALSTVMGHASITITFDTYGHLMPGGESEVGRLLGNYLS